MKKLYGILLGVFLFLASTMNVYALNVQQESLTVEDKSATIIVNDEGIGNLEIHPKIKFQEVGDYITYKLVLKNTDGKKYRIESIIDNNTNSSIKMDYQYNQEMNVSNKEIKITLTYYKKTRLETLQNIQVTMKLIDEDDQRQNVIVNNNPNINPNWLDENGNLPRIPKTSFEKIKESMRNHLGLTILFFIIVFIVIIHIIRKEDKKNGILLLILFLTFIPTIVFSQETKNIIFKINLNNASIRIQHQVTFDSTGGTLINPQTVENNGFVTKPVDPTKEGYDFVRWLNETNEYDFTKELTSDKVLTAEWKVKEYTITYHLNDGNLSSTNPTKYTIETDDITLKNPTKEGHQFIGWTGSNGDIPNKDVTISKGSMGDKTYTANYQINTYNVQFDSNGGSSVSPQTINYNSTAIKPTNPTKEGYEFVRWLEGTNEYDFTTPVTSDKSLTAEWKIVEYTITYGTANGMNLLYPNPTKYTIETETFTLSRATRIVIKNGVIQNYVFKGWESSYGSEPVLDVTIPTGSTGNRHYAPVFNDAYRVTYNPDGGTIRPTSFLVEANTAIGTLAIPTRDHYTFDAWYLGTTKMEEDYIVNSAITIVAKWNKAKYTVSFNTKGGNSIPDQTVEYQDKAKKPTTNPTKEGYNFVNWYKDEEYTTVFDFDTEIEKDTTIYAKYEKKDYTITYNPDGGTVTPSSFTKKYEEEIGNLAQPTKTGYDFDGWFIGNEKIESNYVVKNNITLTAKYTPKEYTITYKLNGGSAPNPTTYTVETEDFTLNNVTPPNNVVKFLGWIGSNGNTPKKDLIIRKGTTGNLTYEAVFGNAYTVTFDVGNGTLTPLPDDRLISEGEKIGALPTNPTPPDEYKFDGWYVDETKIDDTYIITKDTTVKAGYVYQKIAEVIEELEGEDVLDSSCVVSSNTAGVTKLDDPFGNVRYVGACPKNYVWYNCKTAPTGDNYDYAANCERWRIIGTFKDVDDGTGKKSDRIKIMRNESLGELSWDTNADTSTTNGWGSNQWGETTYENGNPYPGSKLKIELNTDYLDYTKTGTTTWYNGRQMAKTATYNYSNSLSQYAQSLMGNAIWHIGAFDVTDNGTIYGSTLRKVNVKQGYLNERSGFVSINDTNKDKVKITAYWTGKVALANPSDYGYSTNGGSYGRNACINNDYWINSGGTPAWNSQCYQNSWIYHMIGSGKRMSFFGRSFNSGDYNYSTTFVHKNNGLMATSFAYNQNQTFPSLFLGEDVRITGGEGSYQNPFTVDHKKVMISD